MTGPASIPQRERSTRGSEHSNYADVRLAASDHSVPLPALRGSLAASQPRNFRMTGTGGAVGAKVDLGSNSDQFWVYVDAPTMKPTFVFASHSDFESGKAKLPAGIAFEPDWVMQALGMTTLPPDNQPGLPPGTPTNRYSVKIDDNKRTYTLSWPASHAQRHVGGQGGRLRRRPGHRHQAAGEEAPRPRHQGQAALLGLREIKQAKKDTTLAKAADPHRMPAATWPACWPSWCNSRRPRIR